MVGVTVKQKDKPTNATATDAKGNYSLTVADDKIILVFSFIGYDSQEYAAKDIVNGSVITMKANETKLQEVVISKGYYNEKRALSTGDISVVTSKEIEEQPVTDVMQTLEGKVPGLFIQQSSGAPGAYAKIHIMGQNSLFNGSDPLYVIDGVPYTATSLTSPNLGGSILGVPLANGTNNNASGLSPFSLIDPANIENIEVLKDADATAIYGSRGANGVILITTKKGKAGDTRVDFDISQGNGKVTRTLPLLNTQQYLQMRRQAFTNDGVTPSVGNGSYDLAYWDTTRYTDWQKLLIGNTAHYTDAHISLSGGNSNTQFMLSGSFNRQTTVFPGDYDDKKSGGFFSLNHQSSNQKFTAQFSASYLYDNSDLPAQNPTTLAFFTAPDAPGIYNPDGTLNWQTYNGTATWRNPLAYTLVNYYAKTSNLTTALNLSYLLARGITFSAKLGYTRQQMDQVELTPAASYPPPNNTNPFDRSNQMATNESSNWSVEPQLSYRKKIGKGQLNALVGTAFQEFDSSSNAVAADDFASDALISYPAASPDFYDAGNNNAIYRYNAVYGQLGYHWDEEFLFNLTGRRDGSSRFGAGRQWGNFGGVGTGWIFTKEKFIEEKLPWLSFGKLRASYGITGNDQIANYQFLSQYQAGGTTNTYLNAITLAPKGLPNADLGWETVKKLQIGADLGFLKDRIDLTVTWYRNRSGDQLGSYSLPALTGFTSIQENLPASIQNSGWEFTLNTQNVSGKGFKWNSSINLTLLQNQLLAYPNIQNSSYATVYAIDHSIYSTYVYQYLGVNPQTGIYTYKTQNSNGLPSNGDKVLSQPVTQSAYGGFSNSLSYGHWRLDLTLQFVKQLGYNYLRTFANPGGGGNSLSNQPLYALGAWHQPGEAATIEKYTQNGTNAISAYNDLSLSTAAISDASYLRLRNMALSYSLPDTWTKAATMRSARVYLRAENLFTITGYKGLDPETQGASLPPLQIITLGLQVGF